MKCFDPGCAFEGDLPAYTQHVYEVHTEDSPGTDRWEITERVVAQGVTEARTDRPAPLPVVRNDCAFCHRERSARDDNHAPECPYWTFFGGNGRG